MTPSPSGEHGVQGVAGWPLRLSRLAVQVAVMSHRFACDIGAIPADERPSHHELTRRLMAIATTRETTDGFSFEFPAAEYAAVVRFVALERLCCPFLGFTVDVPADQGPLRLRLTGPVGAKAFIRAELDLPT